MSGDEELIRSLVGVFNSAKKSASYVSLRMYYEDENLHYFLTNVPMKSKDVKRTDPMPTQDRERIEDLHILQPSPVQTRQSRRKRKKVSTPQDSPEQIRNSSENQTPEHVSTLDLSRNLTEITIPCQNDFQALSEFDHLFNDSDDDDEDKNSDEDDLNHVKFDEDNSMGNENCSVSLTWKS